MASRSARARHHRLPRVIVGLTTVLLAGQLAFHLEPARSEAFLDLYTGKSFTEPGDLHVRQRNIGDDFRFHDISFGDKSFEDPPWYGGRAGYFFERAPVFGLAAEYFHFKLIADDAETRRLTGLVSGVPTDTHTFVHSLVQKFQLTHGVNYLTLDGLLRYSLWPDAERFPHGRAQIYLGGGVGPVIVHAEDRVHDVTDKQGYEIAGIGLQAFAGVRMLLLRHLGMFVEYKITHSSLDVGVYLRRIHVDENTHHIAGGLTIPF